jgi:guanine deaminase
MPGDDYGGAMTLAVAGTLMQTPAPDRLAVTDAVIEVDVGGAVTAVHDRSTSEGVAAGRRALAGATERVELAPGTVLLPGLVDLHIHAPQWPQLGTGLDLPLERWLFEYTFPLEARYSDEDFAASVWDDLVPTLLSSGTTTAVYFSSNHLNATTLLAQACARHGQRALVGRVAMDHPEGTPDWYRDTTASAGVDASARSIEAVAAMGSSLVEPVITPRFTPACTDGLLEGLGELAEATGVRVQTHCAESDWHCGYAIDRFGTSDPRALDRFGLMRPRTVLAHSDHLTDFEMAMAADRRAGVAHCPLSNSYFANAVFRTRQALSAGVGVGLGSDIAGGARLGLLGVCQDAVTVSRMLEDGVDPALGPLQRGVADSRIDTLTAFWLATAGGAAVVDLPVGLIEPGRRFDAIAVRLDRPGGLIRTWEDFDTDARIFEKVVRLATADDITHVWVDGDRVKSEPGSRS